MIKIWFFDGRLKDGIVLKEESWHHDTSGIAFIEGLQPESNRRTVFPWRQILFIEYYEPSELGYSVQSP